MYKCEQCQKDSSKTKQKRFCSLTCYWASKQGKKHSEEHSQKISRALKGKPKSQQHIINATKALEGKRVGLYGEKNPAWKGEKATYSQIHDWLITNNGHPAECTLCQLKGKKVNNRWIIDWANISGQYKRDMKDWMGLCRGCHNKFDKGKSKRVQWVNKKPVWNT